MKAFKSQQGREAVVAYYHMLLGKLTVPYEELTVETTYGSTAVLAAGDTNNPPLVLLHGSSINATMWIGDMNTYAKAFRVYAPDMPGEPGKSSEEQYPFDTMDYVEWLSQVFCGLKIEKTALAGASLGAWLAVKFASHYPKKVEKLVLMCPAGVGSQNHAFKDIAIGLLSKGEAGIDELFRQINGGAAIPQVILDYQKLIAAVFNSRMEVIPVFADEELEKLIMPSLLLVGEKDIMLNSLETAARFRKSVPNGQISIIPQAGHSLTGFAQEIMAFLKR